MIATYLIVTALGFLAASMPYGPNKRRILLGGWGMFLAENAAISITSSTIIFIALALGG